MQACPVIDVAALVGGSDRSTGSPPSSTEPAGTSGSSWRSGHGSTRGQLEELLAATCLLRPRGRREGRDRDGPGGPGLAGLVPARRRADLGGPGRQGGHLLRRGAPAVRSLLHGPNLFPERPPELRDTVLDWMAAMTGLGHVLMGRPRPRPRPRAGLDRPAPHRRPGHALPHLPLPAGRPGPRRRWGVAEHTDYGLLTILADDGTPGLEVRTRDGWTPVEPVEGGFVCNLGDMLERMTAGRYRSTPHRVRPPTGGPDRLSCPFFFDPGWDVEVGRSARRRAARSDDRTTRTDGTAPASTSGPAPTATTSPPRSPGSSRTWPDLVERRRLSSGSRCGRAGAATRWRGAARPRSGRPLDHRVTELVEVLAVGWRRRRSGRSP